MIDLKNMDCLEAMKQMDDNEFDLAIVDPPYGINVKVRVFEDGKNWDSEIPSKEYFNHLFRVSKNQIIWGANYFLDYLGATKSIITWDKLNTDRGGNWTSEIAWSSIGRNSIIIKAERAGRHGFYVVDCERIHPTQKPVKLYEWLLDNYANEGDKILDTHLGSGSIALACHNRGFDLTGFEIDKEYFDNAVERLRVHQSQLTMF